MTSHARDRGFALKLSSVNYWELTASHSSRTSAEYLPTAPTFRSVRGSSTDEASRFRNRSCHQTSIGIPGCREQDAIRLAKPLKTPRLRGYMTRRCRPSAQYETDAVP